jgi:cellulase
MRGAAVLLVTFLGGASALTGSCQNWCSKYTCGTTAHCGGCTEANQICQANRPCTTAFDSQCSGTVGATLMGAHRMCNEVSSCAPFCSCDTVAEAAAAAAAITPGAGQLLSSAPSGSSAPVAAPTGTCDVAAMSSLKSKLNSLISAQRTKNSALTQTVYPGTNPFPPPAAPSPPPTASSCAKEYAQCGGQTHKGPTCCQLGSNCRYQNAYYSQCRK